VTSLETSRTQALCRAGGHDNIVTLYDRGSADGTDYLVFEYLAGGTLRNYFQAVRRLPVDEIMRFGRQLARALSQLHQRGLIHRDVAPANVWLDERNVAHLGDFDSAVKTDEPQDPKTLPLTTEAYASPEQTSGGHVDERSDLYSLGAVLYEAATGERPRPGQGGKAIAAPSALRPDLPPALDAIIHKLLAECADDRPASADDVLAALRSAGALFTAVRGFLPWADTLPFPLASVLWGYHAELDPRSKVDYLLKFLEALAQFVATVQLSAYRSDPAFFNANRSVWFGTKRGNPRPVDFRMATFGMWVMLSQRLATTGRSLLSAEDGGADRCYELYGSHDPELLEALTSTTLIKILQEAVGHRNAWTGHSGVVGPQEQRRRLRALEDLLIRTRASLNTAFETWILLKPGPAAFSDGIFDLTATRLMGTRSVFRKERMQVGHPLDTGRLYLLYLGSLKALELVPLIRIIPGQKTEEGACYFYNRLESNRVRWVSYHLGAAPLQGHQAAFGMVASA